MKGSEDLLIRRSEDRKGEFTAETRSRGGSEDSCPTTDCVQSTRQVSGPDFSRAERSKEFWALAPAVFRITMHTISAALREIFDESAYDRFLLRTNAARSIASYRAFTSERDAALVKKPRCC